MATQNVNTNTGTRAAAALNHLCHGATSKSLFLPGENPADFFALLEGSFEHHQPTNSQDAGLVADSVIARWFLLRHQRTYSTYEFDLHAQKPAPETWDPSDLHKLDLFDRYKTRAERTLGRALNNVRQIRKEAQSESRWQTQHALQRERFELTLRRETRLAAANSTGDIPLEDLIGDAVIPLHQQTLYIGLEDEDNPATSPAKIFETTPTNEQLAAVTQKSDTITRTYNFVGGVPASYQHLVATDAVKWGMSTAITKTYTYEEWQKLTQSE